MRKDPISLKFFGSVTDTKRLEKDKTYLGTISGIASTNDLDRHDDIIISDVLKDGATSLSQNTTVFFNHQHQDLPIGKILSSEFRQNADKAAIGVDVGISKTAPQIWTLVEEGILDKFSIGMRVLDFEIKELDEKVVFYITKAEIVELSLVGLPANPNASVDSFSKVLYKSFEPIRETYLREKRINELKTKAREEGESEADCIARIMEANPELSEDEAKNECQEASENAKKRLQIMDEKERKELETKIASVSEESKNALKEFQEKTDSTLDEIKKLIVAQKREDPEDFVGSRQAPLGEEGQDSGITVANEQDELRLGMALMGKYIVDRRKARRPVNIELFG